MRRVKPGLKKAGRSVFERAQALPGAPTLRYQDHRRRAKKRLWAIDYTRGRDKQSRLYRDLVQVTRKSLGYLDQTERRVFQGENVPAADKIVSLFEPHTDILVKARRETRFGHKLNLTTGKSGLILDAVIEAGNPADSERFLPLIERHRAHYGRVPRQVAADGGYASTDNLERAKALGIQDVAFHKKRGLKVEEMTKSPRVYRKLRNFRAGIEAGISCLKRAYGLARCTWKGLDHVKAYIWSSIVAHNLTLFARLAPA